MPPDQQPPLAPPDPAPDLAQILPFRRPAHPNWRPTTGGHDDGAA